MTIDTSAEAVERVAAALDAVATGADDCKTWLVEASAAMLRALSASNVELAAHLTVVEAVAQASLTPMFNEYDGYQDDSMLKPYFDAVDKWLPK